MHPLLSSSISAFIGGILTFLILQVLPPHSKEKTATPASKSAVIKTVKSPIPDDWELIEFCYEGIIYLKHGAGITAKIGISDHKPMGCPP